MDTTAQESFAARVDREGAEGRAMSARMLAQLIEIAGHAGLEVTKRDNASSYGDAGIDCTHAPSGMRLSLTIGDRANNARVVARVRWYQENGTYYAPRDWLRRDEERPAGEVTFSRARPTAVIANGIIARLVNRNADLWARMEVIRDEHRGAAQRKEETLSLLEGLLGRKRYNSAIDGPQVRFEVHGETTINAAVSVRSTEQLRALVALVLSWDV